MRESVLKAFAAKGFLPPKEVAHWRAPGREEFPQPRSDEVVSFVAFHEHGLGYPVHWFLHGLLNEWGLSCSTLTQWGCCTSPASSPSTRLFLKMEPHADFFRRLFSGRALTVGNPTEITSVGVLPYREN